MLSRIKANKSTDLLLRYYSSGEFRAFRWKNLSDDEKRRLGISKHEATHCNIEDRKTKTVRAILTSAKGNNAPPGTTFDKLSSVKYDGTYVALKNKETKQTVLDNNGNVVPDPQKGGQYMATLQTSRKVMKDARHKQEDDPKANEFVQNHSSKIRNLLDKNNTKNIPKNIGGQDNE